MKKQILLAASISSSFRSHLESKGYELVNFQQSAINYNVQGIITSTKLKLEAELLKKFTNLKWVARLGSGIEIIDTAYCKQNKIAFASSPAGIANAVAEHCVAMLVSLQKNVASSFLEVKNRQWIREANRGWELEGKTIGLVGYGHTAKAFAKKLSVYNVNTLAFDKFKSNFSDEFTQAVSLNELQEKADIISFHVPLNEETKHYYNSNFIANCKPHILLNTARGPIVSTKDLLIGLQDKSVLGAALDVLENEHQLLDEQSKEWNLVEKLLKHNVLITPHIAGYSHDGIEKMSAELLDKLKDHF